MADTKSNDNKGSGQGTAAEVDWRLPSGGWMSTKAEFRPGTWLYPAKERTLEALHYPNPRRWSH